MIPRVVFAVSAAFFLTIGTVAQEKVDQEKTPKAVASIGGAEHDMTIYGVKIGMDVPTALESVFVNAARQPGQEKPDAQKREGKNEEDIRVLYKDLPLGTLQVVFAKGKFVKEIVLTYKNRMSITDLRLASSSDINLASTGERFDDRYTIGFSDSKKQEKLWWRDENSGAGYDTRISFLSGHILRDGQLWWQTITTKAITIKPGDEKKFNKALNL